MDLNFGITGAVSEEFECPKCKKAAKRERVVTKTRKLKDGSLVAEQSQTALVCGCGVMAYVKPQPARFYNTTSSASDLRAA